MTCCINWRLWWEEPPRKSWVSLANTLDALTGLSVDLNHVFGTPDRGCVATSCFAVPSEQRSFPSFQTTFCLTTVFFAFVLLLIPNMLLLLHYAVRVHVKSPIQWTQVCESVITCVGPTSQSISLCPNSRPGWNRMSNFILSSSTTHSWLLWDFLCLFVGCFWGVSSMDFG